MPAVNARGNGDRFAGLSAAEKRGGDRHVRLHGRGPACVRVHGNTPVPVPPHAPLPFFVCILQNFAAVRKPPRGMKFL